MTEAPAVHNDAAEGGDAVIPNGGGAVHAASHEEADAPTADPPEPVSGESDDVRIGTISSARFNILSTMVGGGCLSLPMAFQQSGNLLVGPLMLLLTGVVTEFCFKTLVATAVHKGRPHPTRPGRDTFESITSEAFGTRAYVFSMGLVVLMCFFGTVGYAVLLRDMMEPLNHAIAPRLGLSGGWLGRNLTMFAIVLLVTPFCTLRRLTALKDCGLASMLSLLILGSCVVFRSVQCNCGTSGGDPWYANLALFPESWRDLLDALPLFISCFVCHYNILPVHNELEDPSPARVGWWLRSTTWFAVALYMVMGFAGSAYAPCTPTGTISGNILLDFDENDPLLMVGRMCLAVTITLAFPMLVIPGRDIVVRSLILPRLRSIPQAVGGTVDEELREPLLEDPDPEPGGETSESTAASDGGLSHDLSSASAAVLLCTSVAIFWSAATLASVVSSIDVVWDLLGSSLSILLSYLIPAGTYLVVTGRPGAEGGGGRLSRALCWLLLWVFVPLMVASTANAVANTFS